MKGIMLAIVCAATLAGAADSVWTEPAKPTTRDSITFHLFLENNCCCTQYYNKGVSAEDTVVYLYHDFDTDPCMLCDCFARGSWTEFVSGPLAAGTYAVHSAGQIYCPPEEICPFGMMAPVRVGVLTVSLPSAVAPAVRRSRPSGADHLQRAWTLDGRPVSGVPRPGVVICGTGVVRAVLAP